MRSSSVQQNIFPRGLHIHFGEHVVRIPDSCRSGKHRFSELLRYHNHPSLPPHSPIHHIHVHRIFTATFVYSAKVPSLTFAKLTTSPTMIGLSTFLKHPGCHLPTMRSKHVRPRGRRYPKLFMVRTRSANKRFFWPNGVRKIEFLHACKKTGV